MRPASFQDCLVQLVVTLMIFMSVTTPTARNGRKISTKSGQPIDGEPPSKEVTGMLGQTSRLSNNRMDSFPFVSVKMPTSRL